MLNLARDWLRSYLPHCLKKIDRVSFGLLNADDLRRALDHDPQMPKVTNFDHFLCKWDSFNNIFLIRQELNSQSLLLAKTFHLSHPNLHTRTLSLG